MRDLTLVNFRKYASIVIRDHSFRTGLNTSIIVDVEALQAEHADLITTRDTYRAIQNIFSAFGHPE